MTSNTEPSIALITGCGSGIGKALAINLHNATDKSGSRPFHVYATDYRTDALQDLADMGISTAKMDVTSMPDILQVVAAILKERGHIDLLVCNAGIATGGFLAELDYDEVERTFDVNVHGVFRTVQAVAPHMMARRSGKIATMCSVMAYFAQPFQAAYPATKGAVERMTESLAMELEPFGVSVTSVVPGVVKTDITTNSRTNFDRYKSPDSFYHQVIGTTERRANAGAALGMSTEQAASDIAKGLSKKVPPRFLYTGHSVLELWRDNLKKKKQMKESVPPASAPSNVANGKEKSPLSQKGDEVPLLLRKEE